MRNRVPIGITSVTTFRSYQQWLALAPTATGCPSLGINLSNALRLEVQ